MQRKQPESPAALGFLTAIKHEQHGTFGGFLILDRRGRPLEFHCTAPVKPNRAQQILYGPTLDEFVFAEQIGKTLIDHAKTKSPLICTDLTELLGLRTFSEVPVALVVDATNDAASTREEQIESEARNARINRGDVIESRTTVAPFRHHHHRLAVGPDHENDIQMIAERLDAIGEAFDLLEPFERIREAIQEAQKGSG